MTPRANPFIQQESAKRLAQLHKRIRDHSPFFSSLILRLTLVPDPERKTIAVDGRRLRYNPEWVSQQNIDVLEGALTRLTLACALNHHTRRGDRDYAIWQEASKQTSRHVMRHYELDGWQAETGPSLEMSIEKAYQILYEQAQDSDQPQSRPQQSGQSGPGASGVNSPQPSGQPQDPNQSRGSGSPGDQPNDSDHPSYDDQDGQGEVMDSPQAKPKPEAPNQPQPQSGTGPGQEGQQDSPDQQQQQPNAGSPTDQLQEESDRWEQALADAAQRAKQAGPKAGKMAEDIARALRPPMDWKQMLRHMLTQTASRDYTWNMPNRRYIHHGLYFPSRNSRATLPPIIFAIDTSGSVDQRQVSEVWNELQSIAEDLEPERITVLQCDAALQSVVEYDSWDVPLELTVHGRGGTDFRPVFAWAAQESPPACLIYCTDLYCSDYPETPPDYPVLWLVHSNAPERLNPPFGYRIDLDPLP